jgi:hypothetical protein
VIPQTHLNRHNDVKPHGCPKCERRFVEKGELRKHDNAVHLKLRPFVCQMPSVKEGDICPRSFATHGNLKVWNPTVLLYYDWDTVTDRRLRDIS